MNETHPFWHEGVVMLVFGLWELAELGGELTVKSTSLRLLDIDGHFT